MTFADIFDAIAANPVLLLVLITAPIAGVAWLFRTFPSFRLLGLLAVPSMLTAVVFALPQFYLFVLIIDFAIVVVACIDFFFLPKLADFELQRECRRVASLNKNHEIKILLTNRSTARYRLSLRDGIPQSFEATPDQFDLTLKPKTRLSLRYEVKPFERGAFDIDAVHLRVNSRWSLWLRYLQFPLESAIHVYPDMKQLTEYALLARTNRLSLLGVRRTRQIGQDNDFERLRDYTLDDNYKHIDWRSTARRNKLTVKDFQTSQSQRVVFLLDCGRMMTNVASDISLLDHSLNAILMLSYVALERGDSVGLITFSDSVHSFVPPRGGRSHMNSLLHASFDRFPNLVESRYDEAFLYLNHKFRKRSLVVLITNVIDEVNAMQIERHLIGVRGRHLPIGVFLRDHQLFDSVKENPKSTQEFYQGGAAAQILCWRHQIINDLQHRGVLSLDLYPENMTAPLINKYLEIKARNLL